MARHISYSELSDLRQCPLKHRLGWVDGWRPTTEKPALSKGRLFHEVLAAHYRAVQERGNYEQAALAMIAQVEDEELRELAGWMYEGYLESYGHDDRWTILAVEKVDQVWLRTAAGGRSGYQLKTVIDLLVADELGRVWLVDHKTGADFPGSLNLEIDDQLPLYQWGLAQRGIDVYGLIYNCCRTRRNKKPMALEDRFRRVPFYCTPTQLSNIAADAWRTARRVHATPWAEPATDRERCVWRCDFTEACLYQRKGGRIEDFLESQGFAKKLNGNGNGRATEES